MEKNTDEYKIDYELIIARQSYLYSLKFKFLEDEFLILLPPYPVRVRVLYRHNWFMSRPCARYTGILLSHIASHNFKYQ